MSLPGAKIREALDLHPDVVEELDKLLARLDAAEDALVSADHVYEIIAKDYQYKNNAAAQIIRTTHKTKRDAHVAIVSPPPPPYVYRPAVPPEDRYEPDEPWCRL